MQKLQILQRLIGGNTSKQVESFKQLKRKTLVYDFCMS